MIPRPNEHKIVFKDFPTIVLVTSGKHESVDFVKVVFCASREDAEAFCKDTNTGRIKHWTKAEIVKESETIELWAPEEVE